MEHDFLEGYENFKKLYDFVVEQGMLSLSIESFGTNICMLMEEYCKHNNLDVCKLAEQLQQLIKEVNEDLGKY